MITTDFIITAAALILVMQSIGRAENIDCAFIVFIGLAKTAQILKSD